MMARNVSLLQDIETSHNVSHVNLSKKKTARFVVIIVKLNRVLLGLLFEQSLFNGFLVSRYKIALMTL